MASSSSACRAPNSVRAASRAVLPRRPGWGLVRSNLRILRAEDNVVNQKIAVRLLEKSGHAVVVAGDGREALAVLEKEPFDLVLMDVQMPEMSGLAASLAIREREKRTGAHIPIVAMTAHAMKGDRERCLEAGMDGYVSKAIHPQKLLETIDSPFPVAAGAGKAS